jgi:L-cystine uptake protein TcyP (sodium:dicarboxylate symporter family)
MTAFLSGIWSKVLVVAAIVGAVLAAIFKLKAAGRAQERADQAEREHRIRREADEVERMVDRAGDGELDELRRKWTRQ